MNNFKELEKSLSENREFTMQKVKNNLVQTRGIFSFIGDLVELFLPRIANVLGEMMGGGDDQRSKYPHEGNTK